MKKLSTRIFSLMLAIIPMAATSQNNIYLAFEAIIKCPDAKITERHSLEKDPVSDAKLGQCDIYTFVLPAKKFNLVEKAVSAFNKDSRMAYSINSGKATYSDNEIQLAVGDASSGNVYINNPGYEYIYALFLPSIAEDPDGTHRYAYAMNYRKDDGKVEGKLVITYATTLKYRQQAEQERRLGVIKNLSSGTVILQGEQQTWFETLMSYLQGMTVNNSQMRIALATKAYTLIQDLDKYPEVTTTDINAAREVLKAMISDKKYSETVLNKLLNQCLISLK